MKIRILALLIFFATTVCAQNEDQLFRQIVNEIVKELAEAQKTKDASKILQHFSPDVRFTNVEIGINGKVKVTELNFDGVTKLYLDAFNEDGESLKITGVNIAKIVVQDETGVIDFVYDYELSVGSGLISKGTESAIYTLRKASNGWKIHQAYQVSVETVQNRGICKCELFKGNSGYASKIIYPFGREYITGLDKFTFKNTPTGKVITVGSKNFIWEAGVVNSLKQDGKPDKELGKATGDEDAIRLILEKSIYDSNCSQVSIKK